MATAWHVLADSYVDRIRTELENHLRRLRDQNEITEDRIAFHLGSRESLAVWLEGIVGGSGAGPEELQRFREMSEIDIAAFKEIATDTVRMHFLKAMVHDAEFTRNGSAFEVAGATNAAYWYQCFASQASVDEFWVEFGPALLTRFVETDDEELRRCLVNDIKWQSKHYAPKWRPLLKRAARIAAEHRDAALSG